MGNFFSFFGLFGHEQSKVPPSYSTLYPLPPRYSALSASATQMSASQMSAQYFSPQKALFCGKHAINNLFNRNMVSSDELYDICQQLSEGLPAEERQCDEDRESGNYSVDVLSVFFLERGIQYELFYANEAIEPLRRTIFQNLPVVGFIVGTGAHWLAVRKSSKGWYWKDSIPTFEFQKLYPFNDPRALEEVFQRIMQNVGSVGGLFIVKG